MNAGRSLGVLFVPWSNFAAGCESGAGRPLFVRALTRVDVVRRREVWDAEEFALGVLAIE